MPLSELPLSLLVIIFLTVFVLIGINPGLQRAARKLRKRLHFADLSKDPFSTRLNGLHAGLFAGPPSSRPLNDFEMIVLQRLAQSGGKSLSRKELNASLLLGPSILHQTLDSLFGREMVAVTVSPLLFQQFTLTATGRRYVIEQGYMVEVRERTRAAQGGKGLLC